MRVKAYFCCMAALVLVSCGVDQSAPSPGSTVRKPAAASTAANASPSEPNSTSPESAHGPKPPATPRLVRQQVKIAKQAYFVSGMKTVHKKGCPEITPNMIHTPLTIALMQGYTLHEACASRDDPDFAVVESVSPEWLEYERQQAAASAVSSIPNSNSVSSASPSYEPTAAPSAPRSGDVHVKGYTTKNGTYVAPYTRSKPKK